MNRQVRVRFSPSPTGELHVGTARTALFNWLFAHHNAGAFILRIEDTDRQRSDPRFEKAIAADLAWLGLAWDEGPDVGGPFGPYRQSERDERHREAADELLAKGRAYYCYCTPEELERSREEARAAGRPPRYAERCRDLTEDERDRLMNEDRAPTVRYRVEGGTTAVNDLVRGPIGFDNGAIGDFVLMRSGGGASYNFAAVVDDHDMQISHVIRGEDHLTNTARQLMLYADLGWESPAFAHLSMINGPDGAKLSKRHGAIGIGELHTEGYLPEAVVNCLALLGWSHPEAKEIFTLEEAVSVFGLDRVSKGPAIFDGSKLQWMNAQYIRKMEVDTLVREVAALAEDSPDLQSFVRSGKLEEYVAVTRGSVKTMGDFAAYATIYTKKVGIMDEAALAELARDSAGRVIATAKQMLSAVGELDEASARGFLEGLKKAMEPDGLSGREVLMPLRAALTGATSGPELIHVLSILGREDSLARLADAADRLRGVG